MVFNL